jgi:DNA-binding Xre family transcriptional regulator
MKWNLRLAAANRGIWKASELQRMLAERDLVISAGKMSGLWSGDPASIKLSDLDVICAVLGCGVQELLIPEPGKAGRGKEQEDQAAASAAAGPPPVTPRRRDGRSLPPA